MKMLLFLSVSPQYILWSCHVTTVIIDIAEAEAEENMPREYTWLTREIKASICEEELEASSAGVKFVR